MATSTPTTTKNLFILRLSMYASPRKPSAPAVEPPTPTPGSFLELEGVKELFDVGLVLGLDREPVDFQDVQPLVSVDGAVDELPAKRVRRQALTGRELAVDRQFLYRTLLGIG